MTFFYFAMRIRLRRHPLTVFAINPPTVHSVTASSTAEALQVLSGADIVDLVFDDTSLVRQLDQLHAVASSVGLCLWIQTHLYPSCLLSAVSWAFTTSESYLDFDGFILALSSEFDQLTHDFLCAFLSRPSDVLSGLCTHVRRMTVYAPGWGNTVQFICDHGGVDSVTVARSALTVPMSCSVSASRLTLVGMFDGPFLENAQSLVSAARVSTISMTHVECDVLRFENARVHCASFSRQSMFACRFPMLRRLIIDSDELSVAMRIDATFCPLLNVVVCFSCSLEQYEAILMSVPTLHVDFCRAHGAGYRAILEKHAPHLLDCKTWTPRTHASFWTPTNRLFGAFLLGLDRLVESGSVCMSDPAAVEVVFRSWCRGD